nr:MAG TPA: hypothetical protein [Caudoviricetes sp.]
MFLDFLTFFLLRYFYHFNFIIYFFDFLIGIFLTPTIISYNFLCDKFLKLNF